MNKENPYDPHTPEYQLRANQLHYEKLAVTFGKEAITATQRAQEARDNAAKFDEALKKLQDHAARETPAAISEPASASA